MGDVICRYCGEPWSYYQLKHDLESGEKVLAGEGCPDCEYNTDREEAYKDEWMRSLEEGTDEDPTKYIL